MNSKGFSSVVIPVLILLIISITTYLYISDSNKTIKQLSSLNDDESLVIQKNSPLNFVLSWKTEGTKKTELINIQTGEVKEINLSENSIPSFHVYSENQDYENPMFSADKKKFVYESGGEIWVTELNGINQRKLFSVIPTTEDTLGASSSNPRLSPDGRNIFYQVYYFSGDEGEGPPLINPKKNPTLKSGYWMMNSSGENPFFFEDIKCCLVDWTADSKKIIFNNHGTHSYDIQSKQITKYLDYDIRALSLSDDGEKLFFWSDEGLILADKNFRKIFSLPSRGQEVTHVGKSAKTTESIQWTQLSPDGNYVVFTKRLYLEDREGNQLYGEDTYDYDYSISVYIWNTKSNDELKLPITFTKNSRPFWSKDSKKIIYVKEILKPEEPSHYSEFGDIYVYDLTSNKEVKLTSSGDFHPYDIEF